MEGALRASEEAMVSAELEHEAAFSKHGDQLKILQQCPAEGQEPQFLDAQIFPEWPTLMKDAWPPRKIENWLPAYHEERRAGFYFCANLLQLMENVYIDLNLQDDYDHPDNRGWMNLWVNNQRQRPTGASGYDSNGDIAALIAHGELAPKH